MVQAQEDIMIERTRKLAGTCSNGPCPAIHDTTEPATLAVQGYTPGLGDLAAMGLPEGETVVLVPRSLLDQYADGR